MRRKTILLSHIVCVVFFAGCADTPPAPIAPELLPASDHGATTVEVASLSSANGSIQLPAIDETVEAVDLCALFPGLCGNSCDETDPLALGPSSDRKGFGFKLDGCGNITRLRLVSGHLTFNGGLSLGASVTPGSLGADPGCREVTVTIPGRPAIPAIPPIRNPLTGEILIPGRPGRAAIPPSTVTYRIPQDCDPIRPPSAEITWPSLDGLSFNTTHRIAGNLVLEVAGSGEVDLRFPIPKASKSVTVIAEAGDGTVPLTYKVGAGVGIYGVVSGRLSEAGARLELAIDESYTGLQSWNPQSGWTGTTLPSTTQMASSSQFSIPDTVELAYGVQPAVGIFLEPFPRAQLGALPAQPGFAVDFGLWTHRYHDNVFSVNNRGNIKNDAGAGLESGVYGGVAFLQPGEEPDCDDANVSACEYANFYRQFDCCEADLYDQYGTGVFKFATTTSGEDVDLDPNGYQITWSRSSLVPAPWVDSIMTRSLPTEGEVRFPDGDVSTGDFFSKVFGLVGDTHCAEYYSDLAITLISPGVGVVVPEIRRRGWNVPLFRKTVGCHALPADYELVVSGLADNCTLDGANPRIVALRPSLNLSQLSLPPAQRSGVADHTEVPLAVHCRPLVGDVRIVATTVGDDVDADGYTLKVADAVKGLVEARVPATGESLIPGLRVGTQSVLIGDLAFNCALSGSTSRDVNVVFEDVADVHVSVVCAPVFETMCSVIDTFVADGAIGSADIGRSLCAKLEAASEARARGNVNAVRGPMLALEQQVQALAGKQISTHAADRLINHLHYIRANDYFM